MSDDPYKVPEKVSQPAQFIPGSELPVVATYLWIAVFGLGLFMLLYEFSATLRCRIGGFLVVVSVIGMYLRWGMTVPCSLAGIVIGSIFLPMGIDTTQIAILVMGAILGCVIGVTADMSGRRRKNATSHAIIDDTPRTAQLSEQHHAGQTVPEDH